jgi:hypothetical protein
VFRRACASLLALGLCLTALTGPAAAAGKKRFQFAGKYSGGWTFKSSNILYPNNQRGKLTLSVAAGGKVTGTLRNLTYDTKADVKGSIDAAGELTLTFEQSGQTYTLKGTVTRTKRGRLKGTVDQFASKGYPVGTLELDLSGSPSGRPAGGGKSAGPGLDSPPTQEKKGP